ncbi:unnamed protein product [Paramecium pentaurelia]|uniref:WD40-repeat-containing domain n=1 Tax=Paramecium pentaurelia TaxID=43138 RepID=A0A8S1U5Z8_9CILI|nr:unnamed protein product [Paramecium pentaurelia]
MDMEQCYKKKRCIDIEECQEQQQCCIDLMLGGYQKNRCMDRSDSDLYEKRSCKSLQIDEETAVQLKGNQENDNKKQKELIQVYIQQNQQKQQLMILKQVQLKLIDDSLQQSGYCQAIVFDKTGSIMISCNNEEIKILNFELGRLKLINTYSKHKEFVTFLVYSKLRNNFISGSFDKTILCWQQTNQKEWKCSQPFQQHNDYANFLMLNKQEDQLISGGSDNSIKVWNIDFIKNELNFQQSLDQHRNSVFSFSFNSSETVLVSCGYDEYSYGRKEYKENGNLNMQLNKVSIYIYYLHIYQTVNKMFQIADINYIQLMINNFFGQRTI